MNSIDGLKESYKLILIVGPTGSGKSNLGLFLASRFRGEIINADSRQFYRGMDIGTSKPTLKERGEVSHHLYDCSDLNDLWDASRFQTEADTVIQSVHERGLQPILVGGTGLYIRALLFGLFKGPCANLEFRRKLEERIAKGELGQLHQELQAIDPIASKRIHPNDRSRLIRALEVHQELNRPISDLQAEHGFGQPRYTYLKIGLNRDRAELYQMVEKRVDAMVIFVLENEVKNLVSKWGEHSLLQRAIGYREWFPYFKNEITKDEVINEIKKHTRNLVKQQLTWFKKEKDIVWFHPENREEIEKRVRQFLA